jgi:adenine-specific DNA-methyltransferase
LSESTIREKAEAPFRPFTRKYLGSKRLLREWIADRICAAAGAPRVFLDGFFGTGAVSFAMARRGAGRIVAVDTLRSNCAILRGFTAASPRAAELMDRLNALPPVRGYVTDSYAGTYFTEENCARMDAIRGEIARLREGDLIDAAEHDILLASFLLAADRVANTLGQYDAFLKNIGSDSVVGGRHVVDERVRTPFLLRPLESMPGVSIEVIEDDMIAAAPRLPADVAYYDPPYNGRQYCDNYHVLENLVRWEKPPLFGKTRKFDRTGLRSPFSRRTDAAEALRRLAAATCASHVFLSYSSEGILGREEILGILSAHGAVSVTEIPYPVFGNGAGVSSRRSLVEYLFHLSVGEPGQGRDA